MIILRIYINLFKIIINFIEYFNIINNCEINIIIIIKIVNINL